MNQPFRIAFSIFTAIWLSGCEAAWLATIVINIESEAKNLLLRRPGQPTITETEINVDELSSVKTIALLGKTDTSSYQEIDLGYGKLGFSDDTHKYLKRHLEESGFKVIDLPVDRKNSLRLIDDYWDLDSEVADAYLDIAPVSIGFLSSTFDQRYDNGFGPHVKVALRLISARGKKVIYAGTVRYGWKYAEAMSVGLIIESPEEHKFESRESPRLQNKESVQFLSYGIEAVASGIAKKITTDQLISIAVVEIDTEAYDKSLWNEALVKAECDVTKRKPYYIELRVRQLNAETMSSASNSVQNNPPTSLNPVGSVNLTGTYHSDITTNNNRVFNQRGHRRVKIKFEQIGKCIIGTNRHANLTISGIREDDKISFFALPSDITDSEIKGTWKISADGTRIEGKWTHPDGSGKWNLTKAE